MVVETAFSDQYQRNNKGTGQKNLRCFPHCSEDGHHSNCFCGAPVVLTVRVRPGAGGVPAGTPAEAFRCFGQVVPEVGDPGAVARAGDWAKDAKLKRLCSSKVAGENKVKLYQAALAEGTTPEADGSLAMRFEFSRTSWHYNWKSNRNGPKVRSGGLWANGGR